ncbi:MAG: hypothetical protein WD080_03335 [Egibacteraceae bacterium]
MHRIRRFLLTMAAGLVLLTACGGNGAGSSPDAAATTPDAEMSADTTADAPDA